METLWLHVRAPFAAYRWMQAGVYRATSPTIPPSAAWGLVLNLACIETRGESSGLTTLVRKDAPALRIAVGNHRTPELSRLYQQLHAYPVGATGKQYRDGTHGAKFHIAPVRRELLVDLDVALGVQAPAWIAERVRQGLRGELNAERYGVPFAGDNHFLFDRLDLLGAAPDARWYVPVPPETTSAQRGSCRMTVKIDRADARHTTMPLFAPTARATPTPPDDAWVWVPHAPAPPPSASLG